MSASPKKPSLVQSMALGGAAASFAVNFTHPIETVKTRMQVSGLGIAHTVSSTAKNEGIPAFWKGIAFAYGRELSYTSVKLGAYAPVRDMMGAGKDAPFYLKFLAGAITGGVGSVIGNPFDVMKTLAQTNKGTSAPLTELVGNMYRDQGILGFYRGVEVNIMRACVLNATKMGVYDISKGYVCDATGWARKDVKTAFTSAFIAGFFMTCTVSPFDRLRTALMNQPTDKKIYNGFTDCAVKTIKSDGFLSLWRGFVPIWARFAPQATLQLLTIEFLYTKFGFKSI
uniref:Mitochondrial carrier protein n=1 Tax=Trieres chinensis TaxID=1514140 RepID=A0A7S1ZBB5_TRICV|mmetsp:Transcript_21899/g.44305  ORF Transcript_21899/g.44305 Transcript_21899/m.44305 type:complete len:284 (+) Transcript_21899:57-908(+)|eukprot:CAMPEP_0183296334 /NCGR_PEP_ID=MMETSP0160_2-20130417/3937_1 /TAXON_ID=2839 ORGANISM="Odontella Sinensis, Strain Grunow 1884" /NCGR_SAMPLE_ID=MMETSP0160_2 /ASSEMBLY_ACC=CAM_ASM_000250 /LENGTH=283 /DNA_ID=CAMNT_0025457941 /DNA_START=57 /DNA_END=908 /DNA_ORIENTATION=+